jgi:hypothetical protein
MSDETPPKPPPRDPPRLEGYEDDTPRREGMLGDLASRFIRAGAEAVVNTSGRIKERGEEFKPRDVLAGAAKAAVRGYLDKLELGKELAEFARAHELEVNATFRLKQRGDVPADEGDGPS